MNAGGRWLALSLALAGSQDAPIAGPLVVDQRRSFSTATVRLEVREDPGGALRIEDVASTDAGWGAPPVLHRARGTAVYWARLHVQSPMPGPAEYVLLPDPSWERASLYTPQTAGTWSVERSGWGVPLAERPLPHAQPVLRVSLPGGEARALYLRLQSNLEDYVIPEGFAVDLRPWPVWAADDMRHRSVQGIYAGLILAMVLYNLFLYLAVRDRIYLLYVLHAGAFGLIWVARSGLAHEALWPSWPRWDAVSTFYVIAAAVMLGNQFVRAFLDTGHHSPRLHVGLLALSGVVAGAALLGLLGAWDAAQMVLAYTSLVICFAYLAAGTIALRRGYRPARIFLLACGVLIVGSAVHVFTFLDVLERTFVTLYGAQIGSAVEVLLLAFALGDRINILKREKEEAEAVHRSGLEREVRERTADLAEEKVRLEEARRETEEANRRLKDANKTLARLSALDVLMGLANRRRLEVALEEEWRRCARAGQPLSVILADVDDFKAYNDHFGHPAGDHCLKVVAGRLGGNCVRAGDLLARYGGEEFCMVLPATDRAGAAQLAERLRAAVEELAEPQAPSSARPVVTISAGVGSVHPGEEDKIADLLAEADRALYEAKRQGRNRVVAQPAPAASPQAPR